MDEYKSYILKGFKLQHIPYTLNGLNYDTLYVVSREHKSTYQLLLYSMTSSAKMGTGVRLDISPISIYNLRIIAEDKKWQLVQF